jgi:hypothetical protein
VELNALKCMIFSSLHERRRSTLLFCDQRRRDSRATQRLLSQPPWTNLPARWPDRAMRVRTEGHACSTRRAQSTTVKELAHATALVTRRARAANLGGPVSRSAASTGQHVGDAAGPASLAWSPASPMTLCTPTPTTRRATTPAEESVRHAVALQLIINRELGLNFTENPRPGSFAITELTNLVEAAVYEEFDRISDRAAACSARWTPCTSAAGSERRAATTSASSTTARCRRSASTPPSRARAGRHRADSRKHRITDRGDAHGHRRP